MRVFDIARQPRRLALLTPLREATSASNLAFVFLAFTIVVAELGGALPALVAALVSAMSLNFFLTEPYLTLSISKTDDFIAFVALAACALIAAAFGSRRERWSRAAGRAHEEITLLRRLVDRCGAAPHWTGCSAISLACSGWGRWCFATRTGGWWQ